ncbi:peptidoglycan recognition protein family protein, partial [Candidatus Gracilibacteria bacterium]|nr:peptidoglycan recognition protein family protein [Candidatus Gracilibacteria bacterium]
MKIFHVFFLFFLYSVGMTASFAYENPKIISRQSWGADESIRYINSPVWQEIIEKETKIHIEKGMFQSMSQVVKYLQKPDYNEKIENYLSIFFGEERIIETTIYDDNQGKLFWPIQISEKIQGVVIHHTATEYESDLQAIQDIYKFHTLGRKWGDIGYNFIIGKNGEIFEGRAGGEKSVGAHTKRNNIGNIGIVLIGDYDIHDVPVEQQNSLKNLLVYLGEKYKIDYNKKIYFHEDCIEESCSAEITSQLHSPIIGHRDSGHTTCPGESVYKLIPG